MHFFSSLIPYVTSFAEEHFYNVFAQTVYGIIVLAVSISNLILSYEVEKANSKNVKFYNETRQANKWLFVDISCKVVGIILAILIYPPLAMISIILTAIGLTSINALLFKKSS